MLFNYLKIAYRSILRNKIFSLINIVGLATGLTCALLILTFVVDEKSYDTFHGKKERIYRLRYLISDFDIARVPPIFKEYLNDYFPEVERSSRMWSRSVSVSVTAEGHGQELRFEETNVNFADAELFEIFDFELVSGTLEEALVHPFSVILNEEIANKYFQDSDPIDQMIQLEGDQSFTVRAVVKDFPSNSHIHFDMLVPYDNMYDLEPAALREGIRANFKMNHIVSHSPTYVLLKEGVDPSDVNERFVTFVKEKIPENQNKGQRFEIQPLLDIHLNSDVGAQAEASGNSQFLWIFIAIGALTLLIACINFVNLSTAKSLQRAKEIGMRKVMGAWNNHLITQFLGESFLTTFFGSILAIIATLLLLPELNALTNKELTLNILLTGSIIGGFVVIMLVTSFLAGIYPAFFVTRFAILNSIKGGIADPGSAMNFRKGLMVVQFMISIVLISGSLIVYDQLGLMRTKPLGFQKELMITTPIQSNNFNSVFGGVDEALRSKLETFENTIGQLPSVKGSTLTSGLVGFGMVNRNIVPEGYTAEDNVISPTMSVDFDFLDVYEIPLLAGRDFDPSFGTDPASAFIINETAVSTWEFGDVETALGKTINLEGKEGKVVGVVQDFHFLSLSEPMRPIILEIFDPQFAYITVKLTGQNLTKSLDQIEAVWNEQFPTETFDPQYMDEALAQAYLDQEQFGKLVGYFAFVAVLISCMGSYGLIMFIASEKRKEIGVRKVLGASVNQLVILLSKRFVFLVLIATTVAVPIVIYFANLWLDDFSYRVPVSPISIGSAAILTMMLVFGTVSIQAFLAAIANPVKALRSE